MSLKKSIAGAIVLSLSLANSASAATVSLSQGQSVRINFDLTGSYDPLLSVDTAFAEAISLTNPSELKIQFFGQSGPLASLSAPCTVGCIGVPQSITLNVFDFGTTAFVIITSVVGSIGVTDSEAFLAQGNFRVAGKFDAPTVPVPAALPLLASGLGALGLIGWRRKRKAFAAA